MHTVFLANYDDESPTGTYRVVTSDQQARLVVTEVPDCISPLEVAVAANVCVIPHVAERLVVAFSELRWGQPLKMNLQMPGKP